MWIEPANISIAELTRALEAGMTTLADLTVRNAVRELYSAENSFCEDPTKDKARMLCLYLCLYALGDWCVDDVCNTLCEDELVSLVSKIEQLK